MTSIDFNKSIIHIGLPKTASTFLQIYSFPEICKKINFQYVYKNTSKYFEISNHCNKLQLNYKLDKVKLNEKSLISNESIIGWDPHDYENFAEKNYETFGDEVNILLTIREPKSFLSSIYVQRCISSGYIIEPERFFLTDEIYSKNINSPKFAVEKFSYKKLINFYKKNFSNVEIIFYEDIINNQYLNKNFKISENLTYKDIKKHIFKKRLSKRSVKTIFKIEKFLNFFGLALHKNSIATEEFENFLPENYNINKSKKKIFNWNEFFRTKFDKIFKSDKFELNFEKLNYIKIDELNEEYNNLKKNDKK